MIEDPLASQIEKVQIEIDPDVVIRDHIRNKVIDQCKMYGDFKVQFDLDKLTKKSDTEYVYELTLPKVEFKDWDLDSELIKVISEKLKIEMDYLNKIRPNKVFSIKQQIAYHKNLIKNIELSLKMIKFETPCITDSVYKLSNYIEPNKIAIKRLRYQLFISILKNPLNLFGK
jgi:hypothetical protein